MKLALRKAKAVFISNLYWMALSSNRRIIVESVHLEISGRLVGERESDLAERVREEK